jgi:N-methylhydantoinase A
LGHYRLGVDVGGTFTDFAAVDTDSGDLVVLKVPTTPADPAEAVVTGVDVLASEHGIPPASIEWFVHGTTLALNTILERNGARVGLLITEGFPDILILRRLRLDNPSNLYSEVPRPLIPRTDVAEVRERIHADGSVETPLDEAGLIEGAQRLVDHGVQALVVSFLHSYRNDEHERAARAILSERFPDLYICTSSEIWPQQREYERTLLSVMNAYVGRRMKTYFGRLTGGLQARDLASPVFSTRSNGGILTADSASELPVTTLLSGPAAGAIGAMYLARQAGHNQIVTLDMGGTSADVAVMDGEPAYSTENRIGDFPVIMPAIDVSSIGAGGGSIAWVDRFGVLKVGPQSAGADPGPACYDRGGTEATVTDAYAVLGIIDPDAFLGGTMRLNRQRAEEVVGALAERMGQSLQATAAAILDVASANMEAEFLPLMARHGVDATTFTLLPFGGAGPTHAFLLARQLGIRRVLVPLYPGALSAIGCLVADVRADFVQTLYRPLAGLGASDLNDAYGRLAGQARDWLDAQRSPIEDVELIYSADMRYAGQSFEIEVRAPHHEGRVDPAELRAAFDRQYELVYFTSDPEAPAEIVNARVQIAGRTPKPAMRISNGAAGVQGDPPSRRTVYLDGATREVDVYQRRALAPGQALSGPCVVEQYDTTVFVPSEFMLTVDVHGNLIGEANS